MSEETSKTSTKFDDHLKYLAGLKKPSETQAALLQLAQIQNRTAEQERALSVLWRAEQAAIRASKARAQANKLLSKKADDERRARNHQMFQSAGLMIVAGLVDTKTGMPFEDPALLLGKLMVLARSNWTPDQIQAMHAEGVAMLAEVAAREARAGSRGHS